MQREDGATHAVDRISAGLLSEAEHSDPSVGSKRRRTDQADASKLGNGLALVCIPAIGA